MNARFQIFLESKDVYTVQNAYSILLYLSQSETIKQKHIEYYNIPCSFDIETSSFQFVGKKQCCMYIWMIGINGVCFIGRTWEELTELLQMIELIFSLSSKRRIIFYVHNLSFEFAYLMKRFTWEKVFALKERVPITAITDSGIEFRCSYLLSGYSLQKVGEHLHTYKVDKLIGYLDYRKIRHCKTPLTDKELLYCVNDIKVVMAYIQECIEESGNITEIPLTQTGYVRKLCREKCFASSGYRKLMMKLTIDKDEYFQLKKAFQGGFVHCNAEYNGDIVENVSSFDFTSSYPTVMVSEKFPMSKGERIEVKTTEEFEYNLKHYCCLFDIAFYELNSSMKFENYISISRCDVARASNETNLVVNNGRIVSAGLVRTTITEQDYLIINKLYNWKSKKVGNFIRYIKGYLPTVFVEILMNLYKLKTELKGVVGKEVEYLHIKELINSMYGMSVTDTIKEQVIFNGEKWLTGNEKPPVDFDKNVMLYNTNRNRFTFFPWGIWVTAYARRNLFTGILAFGDDYVYSDTDSIKCINMEKHMEYINEYNKRIAFQIQKALKYHELPIELATPKTINGKAKPLGVWDFEGTYKRFKSLGAKRYMIETDKGIQITISGLSKAIAREYICDKWYYTLDRTEYNSPFTVFDDGMYIPPEYTGKNTHTYIDTIMQGTVTDYTGISADYTEYSGVYLENADYTLSLSRDLIEYLEYMRMIQ